MIAQGYPWDYPQLPTFGDGGEGSIMKKQPEITIRKAEKMDLKALRAMIIALDRELAKNYSKLNAPFHAKRVATTIKEISKGDHIFVAENARRVFGFIWGTTHLRKSHRLSKLGYIDQIFVDSKYRDGGVGSALINALELWFKKLGCTVMTTTTSWENKGGQKICRKHKMREATIEYWKRL